MWQYKVSVKLLKELKRNSIIADIIQVDSHELNLRGLNLNPENFIQRPLALVLRQSKRIHFSDETFSTINKIKPHCIYISFCEKEYIKVSYVKMLSKITEVNKLELISWLSDKYSYLLLKNAYFKIIRNDRKSYYWKITYWFKLIISQISISNFAFQYTLINTFSMRTLKKLNMIQKSSIWTRSIMYISWKYNQSGPNYVSTDIFLQSSSS